MARNSLTKDQLYNFVKVKGSQVVTNFNHDPAKNANSVILRYGTGDTSDNAEGKVQGGYIYLLEGSGIWKKPDYSAGWIPWTGDYLLAIALGTFNEYSGTPEKVGMLLQGVTTGFALGAAPAGTPLWASATTDGGIQSNKPTTSGNIQRFVGFSLGQQQTLEGWYETIINYTPAYDYSIAP